MTDPRDPRCSAGCLMHRDPCKDGVCALTKADAGERIIDLMEVLKRALARQEPTR